MFKLNRQLTALALLTVTLVSGTMLNVTSASAQTKLSTYQNSCQNLFITSNTLNAFCKKRDGSLKRTSLHLRGIENIDGKLKVTNPNKPSNFGESCTDTSVTGDVLTATCTTRDEGNPNTSSIALHGIENINGNLEYTSSP